MATVLTGTSLATYAGIRAGVQIGEQLPQTWMIPEVAQGLTAFLVGMGGNIGLRRMLRSEKISNEDIHSIVALNAFANVPNEDRHISTTKSLETISDNLVELHVGNSESFSMGSGLLITNNGYVLTAHHVIDDLLNNKEAKAVIKTQEDRTYVIKREHIWYNSKTDIAVVKVQMPSSLVRPTKIKVNQDGKLNERDEVRVLGFRDGQKYNSLGMIKKSRVEWSKKEGKVYDLFETDVRGKPGQSGGVLVNGNGELIGIVVYSSTKSGEQIGVIGGARISNALNYINQIAAKESAKMFD